MKTLLFLTGVITLITTSGCLVSEGGRHGHYRGRGHYEAYHEGHSEVIVSPPTVVVRPPEIIVR